MSKQNGTRLTNDKGLTRIAFDELKKKGSANFRRCRDRDVAPFRQSIQKKIWTKDLRSFSLWRKTAEVLFFACSTVHSHRWPQEDIGKKRHFMTKEDSNNYVFKKKMYSPWTAVLSLLLCSKSNFFRPIRVLTWFTVDKSKQSVKNY